MNGQEKDIQQHEGVTEEKNKKRKVRYKKGISENWHKFLICELICINTFKYHVSCTDGKISVRIELPFFHHRPIQNLCSFL